MSFSRYFHYGLMRISYAALEERTRTHTAYPKTKDKGAEHTVAWPLAARRDSHKHFRKHADGSFSIWYGHRQNTDRMANVEAGWEELDKLGRNYANLSDTQRRNLSASRRKLGVVYPDNTFEFHYIQDNGDAMFLSEALGATIRGESRRGGKMFYGKNGHVHPVYKGLRIKLDTHEAVSDYTVLRYKVNRKGMKDYKAQFDDWKNVSLAMAKQMDDEAILDVAVDVFTEFHFNDVNQVLLGRLDGDSEKYIKHVTDKILAKGDPLGAMVYEVLIPSNTGKLGVGYQAYALASALKIYCTTPAEERTQPQWVDSLNNMYLRAKNMRLAGRVVAYIENVFDDALIKKGFAFARDETFDQIVDTDKGKLFPASKFPIIVTDKSIAKTYRL